MMPNAAALPRTSEKIANATESIVFLTITESRAPASAVPALG